MPACGRTHGRKTSIGGTHVERGAGRCGWRDETRGSAVSPYGPDPGDGSDRVRRWTPGRRAGEGRLACAAWPGGRRPSGRGWAATEVVTRRLLDPAPCRGAGGRRDGLLPRPLHGLGGRFAALNGRPPATSGRPRARRACAASSTWAAWATRGRALAAPAQPAGDRPTCCARGRPRLEFRASIVIGSGSLSFEMVRALVERLPVMICPRWVEVRTQPIAIDDLVAYVLAALRPPGAEEASTRSAAPTSCRTATSCSSTRASAGCAAADPRPVLTPRLSSLWLGLVTPLYARVGRKLIDSLRTPPSYAIDRARKAFAVRPRPLREAIARALSSEDAEFAATRWSDALSSAGASPALGRSGSARGWSTRARAGRRVPAGAFAPMGRMGGQRLVLGNWLWRLRGVLDVPAGGAGMRRGRRDPDRSRGRGGRLLAGRGLEQDRLLRLSRRCGCPAAPGCNSRSPADGDGSRSGRPRSSIPRGSPGSPTGTRSIRSRPDLRRHVAGHRGGCSTGRKTSAGLKPCPTS